MAGRDFSVVVEMGDVANFNKYAKQIKKITKESVDEVTEIIFEESQNLVPVLTGALRASGHIVEDADGNYIMYGDEGGTLDYAVYVHEDLTTFHPNGQAKYLEIPMLQNAQLLQEKIAKRMEKELKGRFR
jgi:hypothetical protein